MDPRQLEALTQRLVQNPHDEEALAQAHEHGQNDPRSYAAMLEKVGTGSTDPAYSAHWLTEAANVWLSVLNDAHRAARALMNAIERDPTQPTAAERLAALYRDKGDTKGLIALLERRGKALAPLVQGDAGLGAQAAALHEELGRIWADPPFSQQKKAIENFQKAIEYDPTTQYAIYALRELYKASAQWAQAIPYFELEQRIVADPERKLALYQDEAEVRRGAKDLTGAVEALKRAREIEGGQDPALKQQLATLVLERVQAEEAVDPAERKAAAALLVELAEAYPGEHGFSYSGCAVELEPANDRAVQLVMYYGEQLEREPEAAPKAALYLKASPEGVMAEQARRLVTRMIEVTGDDSMLDSLAPPPGAADSEKIRALLDIAQALAKKAKKTEAAERYREVAAIDAGNLDAVAFLEGFLKQTRKFQELRELLLAGARSSTAEEPQRIAWLKEAAMLSETQLKDVEGAAATFERVVELDPNDEEAAGHLERLLEKANRWDDLAKILESRAERVADVEARLSLEKQIAKIHETRRNDWVGAGRAWARIAALTPEDETAVETAVDFFEKAERPDLAAQSLGELAGNVADDTARGDLFERLGKLRRAAGDALGAGEAFSESATISGSSERWSSAEEAFVAAEAWDQAATAADEQAGKANGDVDRAAAMARMAAHLARGGDAASALAKLEQANDLDPKNDEYASLLEARYVEASKQADLAALLLRRAPKLDSIERRSELRKRAAQIQREQLNDPDAARVSLTELLEDAEDAEALALLVKDAVAIADHAAAVDYLDRLAKVSAAPTERAGVMLEAAGIVAENLDDPSAAIDRYEAVLELEGVDQELPLRRIAEQNEKRGDARGTARALERLLEAASTPEQKLEFARKLAELYEKELNEPKSAVRVLTVVRELDAEDYGVIGRLCALAEQLEDWEAFVKHQASLAEVEADEQEVSRMTRRLAEVFHEKLDRSDEALAALSGLADLGDAACRNEYTKLGDALGWKGVVAQKLVEWNVETPAGPARNSALKAAFARFVEVGRDTDAAAVAKELARTRGADKELADELEKIGIKLKDLDALGIAHDLQVSELSGRARADELVRQAEVLREAGVEAVEAIQHGEQGLASVAPDEVESLLERLSKLATEGKQVVDLYERQVTRCKAPSNRLKALGRAAQIAAEKGEIERARGFFDIALGGGLQDEAIAAFVDDTITADAKRGGKELTRALAGAMAVGGQGARDGGRTRGALLGRAAELAFEELEDTEQAFVWLGESLVAHVDEERLDLLEKLADRVKEPKRAEQVLTKALEEVFDGPLVRKLLDRRAALYQGTLDNPRAAAEDLKRLHDLSPSDLGVMERLSALYTGLGDYRGMVDLYEDQILRGKDPTSRLEWARKVARIWEERLDDPREAADAWRRVLRMKAADPEGAEGLERAKSNMLKRPKADADEGAKDAPVEKAPAKKPEPAAAVKKVEEPVPPPPPKEPEPVEEPAKADEAPSPEPETAAEASTDGTAPVAETEPTEPVLGVEAAEKEPEPAAVRLQPPPKKKKKKGKGRSQPPPAEEAPAATAPAEEPRADAAPEPAAATDPGAAEDKPEAHAKVIEDAAQGGASSAADSAAKDPDEAVPAAAVAPTEQTSLSDTAMSPNGEASSVESSDSAQRDTLASDEMDVELEPETDDAPAPPSPRRAPPPPPSSRMKLGTAAFTEPHPAPTSGAFIAEAATPAAFARVKACASGATASSSGRDRRRASRLRGGFDEPADDDLLVNDEELLE